VIARASSQPARISLAAAYLLLLALACSACGPAQPASAPPPQSSPLVFAGEWGTPGEAPGELSKPAGLAVDLNNRIYLADRGTGRLQKFESDGVPLFSIERTAARTATSLAVDSGGAIYLADAHTGRITVYFPDGDLLRTFRVAPQHSDREAFGFSVAGDGTIFVPDAEGGRIQAFRSNGRLERAWKLPPGPDGQAARPIAVAAGLNEFVYVGDAQTSRIVKYTLRGAQVAVWDAPQNAGPLQGLALSRDHLFVLRGGAMETPQSPGIEVWTLEGELVFGEALGNRVGASSASLYLGASRDEQIFVLDPVRPRVLRFRLQLPAP
jgi:sugar lactone lactonase YvrE